MRSLGTPWASLLCRATLLVAWGLSPLPGTTGDLGEGPRFPLASTNRGNKGQDQTPVGIKRLRQIRRC